MATKLEVKVMDTIIMIAKLMGWTLFAAGLGMLISGKYYGNMLRNIDKTNPMTIFITGLIELPVGVAIVMASAGICWHLALVVMIVGILMTVEGFALLVIPKYWLKMWAKLKLCNYCIGTIALVLACYFIIAT